MKVMMRYDTDLGPRTVVVEVGEPETARAIAESHRFLCGTEHAESPEAFCLEEVPRASLKSHMQRHKVRMGKMRRIVSRWCKRNTAIVKRLQPRLRVAARRP